jgi:sporulation protein YlmC with PRC-barrel domain
MKPGDSIKLVGGLRDLQIVDADGARCGIADDLEFDGAPGGPLAIKAILVGPGAWRGRLPGWAMFLVGMIAGDGMVRVPWSRVRRIASEIHLDCPARALGLMKAEDRARRYIPRAGAL